MLHKKNTFRDFVACAKYLIQHGYTSPQKLTIWGRSAGGLLMGSVVNTHPELFNLVMMGVPFLDVLDTMNDPCLPLVTNEYHEWGNPRFQKVSSYMASYSPLDNINLHNDFPNIYIYTNQHDTLVPYSGPLKYYNKLRHAETFKQGTRKLLFNMQTANGHNQSTMRYSETREYAFLFAIILYFNHLYE
jgi:oligopeptidase B